MRIDHVRRTGVFICKVTEKMDASERAVKQAKYEVSGSIVKVYSSKSMLIYIR